MKNPDIKRDANALKHIDVELTGNLLKVLEQISELPEYHRPFALRLLSHSCFRETRAKVIKALK